MFVSEKAVVRHAGTLPRSRCVGDPDDRSGTLVQVISRPEVAARIRSAASENGVSATRTLWNV